MLSGIQFILFSVLLVRSNPAVPCYLRWGQCASKKEFPLSYPSLKSAIILMASSIEVASVFVTSCNLSLHEIVSDICLNYFFTMHTKEKAELFTDILLCFQNESEQSEFILGCHFSCLVLLLLCSRRQSWEHHTQVDTLINWACLDTV